MTSSIAIFPAGLKIRHKGLFDWGGIYRLVHQWMEKRHFRFHEKRYKDKIDTPLGNEIEVDVWGEKEVTEYLKYKVAVAYHIWEGKEVPVIIDGKKVMRMRGRIHININGEIITDWQGRYAKGGTIHKWMEKFLNDVVLKHEILFKHVDPLDKDLHRLNAEIKKLLKMESHASGVG